MTTDLKSTLATGVMAAASKAGLVLVSATEGSDFHGGPTAVFQLGLPGGEANRTLQLELSGAFDFDWPKLLPAMTAHLAGEAKRLKNPRPDCYVTLGGLPLAFGQFKWPFHRSTSGADTYIVHGEVHLVDGGTQNLHAKVAASVTLTFAEIVPAMEQPYAETFVYNAVRKTVDLGQLEFLKSGNRQPVSGDHALLQPMAEEVPVHGDRRCGAARLPAAQGLLAFGRIGRRQAGLDRRPERRAISEHDRRRFAAHGRRRSGRRLDGAGWRICRCYTATDGSSPGIQGGSGSRAQLHQAAIQRVHALGPREYVVFLGKTSKKPRFYRVFTGFWEGQIRKIIRCNLLMGFRLLYVLANKKKYAPPEGWGGTPQRAR